MNRLGATKLLSAVAGCVVLSVGCAAPPAATALRGRVENPAGVDTEAALTVFVLFAGMLEPLTPPSIFRTDVATSFPSSFSIDIAPANVASYEGAAGGWISATNVSPGDDVQWQESRAVANAEVILVTNRDEFTRSETAQLNPDVLNHGDLFLAVTATDCTDGAEDGCQPTYAGLDEAEVVVELIQQE